MNFGFSEIAELQHAVYLTFIAVPWSTQPSAFDRLDTSAFTLTNYSWYLI